MDVLPLNFKTLWLYGLWYEENEKLSVLKIIYRFLVIFFIFYYTLTSIAEVLLENHDMGELADVLYLALIYVMLSLKILNFVFRRAEMIDILNNLRNNYCKPINSEESEILVKHSHLARKIFICLLIFVLSDYFSYMLAFFLKIFNNVIELPFKTYQFYNTSSKEVFITTSFVQSVTVFYSIPINIAFDTMAAGFLILMSGQLEVNAYRLSKLGEDDVAAMHTCIDHNVLIYDTVEKIESFIIVVVVPLIFFSLLSVCASMFQLSEFSIMSADFLFLLAFSIGILLQILVYCWFGNELTLKSEAITTAVYNSDWVMMSPDNRKSLKMMMLCNKQGRTVSYGGQCSLTLDTFVWILRTCYTMVSLLHQVNA